MKKKRTRILVIVILVIAVIFIGARVVWARLEANLAALESMPIAQVDLGNMEDGVYSGSYSVFPVSAQVSVTVKDHVITGIQLVKHTNGQGAAAEVIPDKVIEAQSLEVDSVSGATYSSKVILKAIENALLSSGN